jgi:rare lipoprotein A
MERNLAFDVSAVYAGHASPAAYSQKEPQLLNKSQPPGWQPTAGSERLPQSPRSPQSDIRGGGPGGRRRRRQAAALASLLASAALVSVACSGNHRPATPAAAAGHVTRGTASWYGSQFNGRRTANGERYDMRSLTAAHPSLPFGSLVQVTNLANGRKVVVRINDRGPFGHRRVIDVSYAAARQLGMAGAGTARVELAVLPAVYRYDPAAQPAQPILLAAAGAPPPSAAAAVAPDQSQLLPGQPTWPSPLAGEAVVAAAPEQQPPLPGQPAPPALASADPGASPTQAGAAGAVTATTRTAEPAATRKAGPAHFTVQVGAFGEVERAGELQLRLASRYPEAAIHSDGIWNRVQVGLFGDREEAEALRREITELGLAAVVVAAH